MEDNFLKLGDVAAGILARIDAVRPKSREEWLAGRSETIGASELPALFGAHAYMTPYELFHIKAGLYAKDFAEAEISADVIHIPPTDRGNLFEDDAFELIARLRPDWVITPNQIPGGMVFIDREIGMSATPDAFVNEPGRTGRAAVQVKTMNDLVFREQWQADGGIEPPVSVAIQAIADATLSKCERAYAAAMVVGFRTSLYLVEVPLHAPLMAKARDLVKDFWRRVEAKEPYAPDFARDGAVIAGLFGNDDGTEIDLSGNNRIPSLVAQREALKIREADGNAAAKERKTIDTELIHALGVAARGRLADGRMIEAPTTRRKGYAVEPTTFRTVKVKEQAA